MNEEYIVKMSDFPKLIFRFNVNSYKNSSKIFYSYGQDYSKIYMGRPKEHK